MLCQYGTTIKGRIITKSKQSLCGTTLQRHYLIVDFPINPSQSLICNSRFNVTAEMYGNYVTNDFIEIIYSKQGNNFYHNIKQRINAKLKPITLYFNILLSMLLISFYPFTYFLSAQHTLIIFSFVSILCVLSVPHHYHYEFPSDEHYIKCTANSKDLVVLEAESDSLSINESAQIITNEPQNITNSDSQTTSNMTDDDNVNEQKDIIDQPQETIAILYEDYIETSQHSMDDPSNNNQDDYVMVFL